MTISEVADWVSIIAGVMTILGLTGVVTWAVRDRQQNAIAQMVLGAAAFTLKISLCGVVAFLLMIPWMFIDLFLGEVVVAPLYGISWYDHEMRAGAPEIWAGVLAAIPLLPVLLPTWWAIFVWSFEPYFAFWRYLRGRRPLTSVAIREGSEAPGD